MDDGYRLGGIKERRKKKLKGKKKNFPLRNGCHTLLGGRSYSVCRTCTKKRKPGTKRKSRAFSRHASHKFNKRNRKGSLHRGELAAIRGQLREPPRGPKSKGTSTSKTTKKANGTNKAKSKLSSTARII